MSRKLVIVVAVGLAIAYLCISVWVSLSVNAVIASAVQCRGVMPKDMGGVAAPGIYERMNYGLSAEDYVLLSESEKNILKETDYCLVFPALHFFNEAAVFYIYWYKAEMGERLGLSGWGIPVSLKLQRYGFEWKIVDKYEEE